MSIDDCFPSRNSPCKSPYLCFSEVPGWQIQCCPLESLGADRRAREVPRGGCASDVCLLAIIPCPHHPELLPPPVTGVGTLHGLGPCPGSYSGPFHGGETQARCLVCLTGTTFPALSSICWSSDLHQDVEVRLKQGGTQEQGKRQIAWIPPEVVQ